MPEANSPDPLPQRRHPRLSLDNYTAPGAICSITIAVKERRLIFSTQRAAWSFGVEGAFWQKSYWDHLLRADAQVERVVEYVLQNPVRRGLVADWREYAFCGSLVFDLG